MIPEKGGAMIPLQKEGTKGVGVGSADLLEFYPRGWGSFSPKNPI